MIDILNWVGSHITDFAILIGLFFGWRELRSKDTTNERESMDLLNIRQTTALEQSRAEVSRLRLELFESQMTTARKIADMTSSSELRLTTVENENRLLREDLKEARQELKEAREQIETMGRQITTLIAQLEVAHNTTTVASPAPAPAPAPTTPVPSKSASLQAPAGSTVSVKVEPDEK